MEEEVEDACDRGLTLLGPSQEASAEGRNPGRRVSKTRFLAVIGHPTSEQTLGLDALILSCSLHVGPA